jgi:hypothetical protein
VTAANDALRFVLELVGIAAAAWWGFHATSQAPARIVLAVAAPVVLVLFWALVVAPGADNPIAPTVRMVIGSVVLLVTAAGLLVTAQATAGAVFAALVVINTIVALVLRG